MLLINNGLGLVMYAIWSYNFSFTPSEEEEYFDAFSHKEDAFWSHKEILPWSWKWADFLLYSSKQVSNQISILGYSP